MRNKKLNPAKKKWWCLLKKSIYFIDKKSVDERSEGGAYRNTITHIHYVITHTNNTTLQKTTPLKNYYSHTLWLSTLTLQKNYRLHTKKARYQRI